MAFALLAAVIVASALTLDLSGVYGLSAILLICGVIAEMLTTRLAVGATISGTFVATVLAMVFVDPATAAIISGAAFVAQWPLERYRWQALLLNTSGGMASAFAAGAISGLMGSPRSGVGLVALVAATAVCFMALNFVTVRSLFVVLDGGSMWQALRSLREFAPPFLLNCALVAIIAEIYAELGLTALIFVLLNMIAFSYMTRLVVVARDRTKEFANLSWGVLSGLVRTLNERDSRAARHCAAVAAFSRDIAKQAGRSKRDQDLAHTAGLLHDIGKFALSDRVMERGGHLAEADWRSIRRHPAIGADLLRDIGVYGPVAEIVRAHHERWDGRGYPDGLRGKQIPELARIVAVAEVYDTLTAPDTYRTPMNSFEALNELRRVAGAQLDPECVEALATLLAGRGTDYRHADDADFDRELDIERRMSEAVAPT